MLQTRRGVAGEPVSEKRIITTGINAKVDTGPGLGVRCRHSGRMRMPAKGAGRFIEEGDRERKVVN